MEKQLHIHILEVLRQRNAIDQMVDIKSAFEDELDSQEKRKNFKTQLDYLVTEGLIETPSKYEFLGWELLTGLYPIDNKKIEGRLVGRWESYLAKRGGKFTPMDVPPPPPAPTPAPVIRRGLYDAPSTVLPYPGVSLRDSTPPSPPPAEPAKPEITEKDDDDDDDDFLPFSAKKNTPAPATEASDLYLKEDDFLPFKTRSQNAARQTGLPKQPAAEPEKVNLSNIAPQPEQPKVEEPWREKAPEFTAPKTAYTYTPPKANAEPEFSTAKTPATQPKAEEPDDYLERTLADLKSIYATPKAEEIKPDAEPEFSPSKTTYTPPKSDIIKDVAVTVTPFVPYSAPVKPEEDESAPPPRIIPQVKRKSNDEEDAPIITARIAGLRAKQAPIPEPQPAPNQPLPAEPIAKRVVNLTSAAMNAPRPAEPIAPTPAPRPIQQSEPEYRPHNPPPPTSNFAAIRFDTDNNPFNALGTIDLTADEEKKVRAKPLWLTVLKWAIITIVILVILVAIVLYKKRYS